MKSMEESGTRCLSRCVIHCIEPCLLFTSPLSLWTAQLYCILFRRTYNTLIMMFQEVKRRIRSFGKYANVFMFCDDPLYSSAITYNICCIFCMFSFFIAWLRLEVFSTVSVYACAPSIYLFFNCDYLCMMSNLYLSILLVRPYRKLSFR